MFPHVPADALAQARTRGSARVIIRLDLPTLPEALLGAAQTAAQRASIARTQAGVLARLGGAHSSTSRRFSSVPYLALQVDESDVHALAAFPEVTEIHIDALAAPSLAQSTAIVGAINAWSAGYTGAGYTIAILDSGVDKTDPFLAGKVVSEACFSNTDASFPSASVCPGGVSSTIAAGSGEPCPFSGCEHGTHVAGIAAGAGSFFSGVARDAAIISIQVFSSLSPASIEAPRTGGSFSLTEIPHGEAAADLVLPDQIRQAVSVQIATTSDTPVPELERADDRCSVERPPLRWGGRPPSRWRERS